MAELLLNIEWGMTKVAAITLTVIVVFFVWFILTKRRGVRMSNGNSVKVARMEIRRSDWDTIETNERAFVFGIGHIANEIMTLRKLLVWTDPKNDSKTTDDSARRTQSKMIIKLLSGKLFEAMKFLITAFKGKSFTEDYRKDLQSLDLNNDTLNSAMRDASVALSKLEPYLDEKELATTIIYKVRNRFGFHYDTRKFRTALAHTPRDEKLEIFISKLGGNCLYQASEVVVDFAISAHLGDNDPEHAYDSMWNEASEFSKWISHFASGCWMVMMERSHKGAPWDYPVETVPATPIADVKIPFFVTE